MTDPYDPDAIIFFALETAVLAAAKFPSVAMNAVIVVLIAIAWLAASEILFGDGGF
jgi:hypothetical protein